MSAPRPTPTIAMLEAAAGVGKAKGGGATGATAAMKQTFLHIASAARNGEGDPAASVPLEPSVIVRHAPPPPADAAEAARRTMEKEKAARAKKSRQLAEAAAMSDKGRLQQAEIKKREAKALSAELQQKARDSMAAIAAANFKDEEREYEMAAIRQSQEESGERVRSLDILHTRLFDDLQAVLGSVREWFTHADLDSAIDDVHASEIGAEPSSLRRRRVDGRASDERDGPADAEAGAPAQPVVAGGDEGEGGLFTRLAAGREQIRSMHARIVGSLERAVEQRGAAESESVAMSDAIARKFGEYEASLLGAISSVEGEAQLLEIRLSKAQNGIRLMQKQINDQVHTPARTAAHPPQRPIEHKEP